MTGLLPLGTEGTALPAAESASVSFADHEAFVEEWRGETVVRALGGANDAAVRQLVVQLGLYDCWPKRVEVLSTGEVRKVLLARAIVRQPRLLTLDKPYDGLDAGSRERLRWILGQACIGFPPALVDTGMTTGRLDNTSVVLLTHRLAEVPAQMTKLWLLHRAARPVSERPMPRGPTIDSPGVPAEGDAPLAAAVARATGATAAEAAAAVGGWRHEADGTMAFDLEGAVQEAALQAIAAKETIAGRGVALASTATGRADAATAIVRRLWCRGGGAGTAVGAEVVLEAAGLTVVKGNEGETRGNGLRGNAVKQNWRAVLDAVDWVHQAPTGRTSLGCSDCAPFFLLPFPSKSPRMSGPRGPF